MSICRPSHATAITVKTDKTLDWGSIYFNPEMDGQTHTRGWGSAVPPALAQPLIGWDAATWVFSSEWAGRCENAWMGVGVAVVTRSARSSLNAEVARVSSSPTLSLTSVFLYSGTEEFMLWTWRDSRFHHAVKIFTGQLQCFAALCQCVRERERKRENK